VRRRTKTAAVISITGRTDFREFVFYHESAMSLSPLNKKGDFLPQRSLTDAYRPAARDHYRVSRSASTRCIYSTSISVSEMSRWPGLYLRRRADGDSSRYLGDPEVAACPWWI
jgi:hypothetical protein